MPRRLRVAFVAGTLECGGAEKQLCYMVRALRDRGVAVRVYSFAAGSHFARELAALGTSPVFVGRHGSPVLRIPALAAAARRFAPHVVQSSHFYTNLYAAACGRLLGAPSLGAVRNDLLHEFAANGRWSRWLLRAPSAVICNSWRAGGYATQLGMDVRRVHVIPNVIDLAAFERAAGPVVRRPPGGAVTVVSVARCVAAKRLDRFLRVLHGARANGAAVRGVLVGEGPERPALEALAGRLGLGPDAVRFLGERHDVPRLLREMDVLLLTSDHEGFPNVVLEAMAAGIPVITTPAGDAARLVDDGVTGYVVPPGAIDRMVERVSRLAGRPDERHRLGTAGREQVERRYGLGSLAESLLRCYRAIGARGVAAALAEPADLVAAVAAADAAEAGASRRA